MSAPGRSTTDQNELRSLWRPQTVCSGEDEHTRWLPGTAFQVQTGLGNLAGEKPSQAHWPLASLAKKDSQLRSVSYKEALEVALCYGWIDGQKMPENDQTWLQRFLSRSSKSIWSKINREKALALVGSGEMRAVGLEAIENAKKNGRWDAAYDSPSGATVPSDFQAALDTNPRAAEFFKTLDRANRYAVLWRIQTVKKAETRTRKIEQFVGMLEKGERIHP
jgi:uncharacterized protein YdeI (YjbR/CyaY-like superfamily)